MAQPKINLRKMENESGHWTQLARTYHSRFLITGFCGHSNLLMVELLPPFSRKMLH